MRVISGILKGRELKGFNLECTRPTMDRVKESVFAMIQDYIVDSTCLDLFSGSGNLGIEAISRGSKKVYLNDKNKVAVKTIKENINNLNITNQVEVLQKDYIQALKYFNDKQIHFDIIFLDPPYFTDMLETSLKLIEEYQLLNRNGIILCESNSLDRIKYSNYFQSVKYKKYGNKSIEILKLL